jgi:hypothetical protein
MFGPIGAAVGKKIAGGVVKNAVKTAAVGRVKNMFQGKDEDSQPREVTIKQPKTMFRGTDMTEFRGY